MKCRSSSFKVSQSAASLLRSTSSAVPQHPSVSSCKHAPRPRERGHAGFVASRAAQDSVWRTGLPRSTQYLKMGCAPRRTGPEAGLRLFVHLPHLPVLDGEHAEAVWVLCEQRLCELAHHRARRPELCCGIRGGGAARLCCGGRGADCAVGSQQLWDIFEAAPVGGVALTGLPRRACLVPVNPCLFQLKEHMLLQPVVVGLPQIGMLSVSARTSPNSGRVSLCCTLCTYLYYHPDSRIPEGEACCHSDWFCNPHAAQFSKIDLADNNSEHSTKYAQLHSKLRA